MPGKQTPPETVQDVPASTSEEKQVAEQVHALPTDGGIPQFYQEQAQRRAEFIKPAEDLLASDAWKEVKQQVADLAVQYKDNVHLGFQLNALAEIMPRVEHVIPFAKDSFQ